ncbi:MAG: triphosphoribosyl-dephospho-CoA synthase [Methylotenera sp.]
MTPEKLAIAFKSACMAELEALKPGNVHLFADGHGMTITDFIKSADATALVIAQPNLSVGERILHAVQATQNAVGLNTNLGIILLCAPLIHAALQVKVDSIDINQALLEQLQYTLHSSTIDDAWSVSQAIVLANPAGLGQVSQYDVRNQADVTLLQMMQAAEHQDRIAWQYAHDFSDIIEFGLMRYQEAMKKWQHFNNKGQNQAWATTALYLSFLSRQCDTHVIRKHDVALANTVMQEAREMAASFWAEENPKLVQKQLLTWDASLKKRNINPGTSADLTVATLLLSYLVN